MTYNFDELPDRRPTESTKWNRYGEDVLPMWIADMDFRSPEPVIRALQERMAHGVFGYGRETAELPALLVERMARLYNWNISKNQFLFLPGVVIAFNLVAHAVAGPGKGVVMMTPVYHPFFGIKSSVGTLQQESPLVRMPDGSYEIDWDAFEAAFDENTRMFLLCNPHNPVGRVFRRDELERMAEVCLRKKVVICSDEIHCDFIYDERQHIPMASIDPEVGRNTITLMAPSKTFNVAGLECAFAIAGSPELRERVDKARMGLVGSSNMIGYLAATVAYREGQPWLDELLPYLTGNRDVLDQFVNNEMPGVKMKKPEGTYLAWLNFADAHLPCKPGEFMLKNAGVALNEGEMFGQGGKAYARLNFACPRPMLLEVLNRMKRALEEK